MKKSFRPCCLLILVSALLPGSFASEPPASLADCDELVRRHPDSPDSYRCFLAIAGWRNQWREAALRLEAILSIHPGNHLARFALAGIEARSGGVRAEENYREAVKGFIAGGDGTRAVSALLELSFFLAQRGRLSDSEAETARAVEVAKDTDDRQLLASVRIQEAWQAYRRADYGRAERLLKGVEETVFAEGPVKLRSTWLSAMGAATWAMARFREAMDHYQRQAELLHLGGNLHQEAVARSNVALLRGSQISGRSMNGRERENLIELVNLALDVAIAGGNREIEAKSHLYMGQIIQSSPEEKRRHYRQALSILGENKDSEDYRQGQRLLGESLIGWDPRDFEEGFRLINEALDSSRRTGDLRGVVNALIVRATMEWYLFRELDSSQQIQEKAILSSQETLEAIEAIRDHQADGVVRARTFSAFTFFYERFVGNLLWPPDEPPSAENLELAFHVTERMRARVLLDELDAAKATFALSPEGPVAGRHERIQDEISQLNRRLMDPGISEAEKTDFLGSLERLEVEEAAVRADRVRTDSAYATLRAPKLATLEELRNSLGEDEAFLMFHIANQSGAKGIFLGGSWLLVHTREDTRVYRLPERTELGNSVKLFLGLFPNRDGTESRAAVSLYRGLLEDPLSELPPGVTRLTIVPDGPLHRLPFPALRAVADGEPLGVRYHVHLAPSATTWLHWRGKAVEPADSPAIALVDPEIPDSIGMQGPETPDVAGTMRTAIFSEWAPPNPLPHARREARALIRHLGRRSKSLEGSKANESFVKNADLRRYGIVHFGAHALVDDEHPERSAVLLAPGTEEEDGLLQIREVVQLDLDGRVVVLSACRSAAGAVLEGEGVLSLARAFFVAGAHAVIGSLWPMRDDEAAALFEDFYRHLGAGESLSGALTSTRRDRIRSGAPAAAWAGLVLLGDGSLVPFPEGRIRSFFLGRYIFLIVVFLTATAGATAIFFHRKHLFSA